MTLTLHAFHRAAESFYLGSLDAPRMFNDSTGFAFAHDVAAMISAPAPYSPMWTATVSHIGQTYVVEMDSMHEALDWIMVRVNSLHAWIARACEADAYYNA